MDIQSCKCKVCGAPVHFDEETQKIVCDYCDSSFDPKEYEEPEPEKPEEAEVPDDDVTEESEEGSWQSREDEDAFWEDGSGMQRLSCPSCGAELLCDASTAATSCPYCGNPAILPEKFSGSYRKPDYVLPFKINKEEAVSRLRAHYRGKLLLPGSFSSSNHIEEVKGIYVPFWLFDGCSLGDKHFSCSNSTSHRQGDYIVTTTQHYDVYRQGRMDFSGVPVDGSSKMPDDYMDSIEPFDYSELKKFSIAYLPGFLADRYDVDSEEASRRAAARIRSSFDSALRDTVRGYGSVVPRHGSYRLRPGHVGYALMPVWLLNTKWQGKTYLFAVNGQTGKMAGDLPIDRKKQNLWFFGLLAGIGTLLSVFLSGPLAGLLHSMFG